MKDLKKLKKMFDSMGIKYSYKERTMGLGAPVVKEVLVGCVGYYFDLKTEEFSGTYDYAYSVWEPKSTGETK